MATESVFRREAHMKQHMKQTMRGKFSFSANGLGAVLAACLMAGSTALCMAVAAQEPSQEPRHDQSSAGPEKIVLHSFGGADGAGALYGVIFDADGDLYGVTVFGGAKGGGAVFEMTPDGHGGFRERVIYSLTGGADGALPAGVAPDKDGNLYAVADTGGLNGSGCIEGCGTVFKLNKPAQKGGAWTETTIYQFQGPEGNAPIGTPVIDRTGAVYGVTQFGGSMNQGAVFKLTPSGSGYTESTLYNFTLSGGGTQAGLTSDNHGALYGTTYFGGNSHCDGGCGQVFKLTPTKSGYTGSFIYTFNGPPGDGAAPFAALTVEENTGAIYGSTQYGGLTGSGIIFKLTPSKSGYTESVLYSFDPDRRLNAVASAPEGQLLLRPGGILFGTATLGGGGCNGIGCGAIYKLKPSASGYDFREYDLRLSINGANPQYSTLISDPSGALYGTARSGGSQQMQCYDGGPGGALGCGTVFKLVGVP
jgi:uncharacterized repeat protein (TIGR03803 family)